MNKSIRNILAYVVFMIILYWYNDWVLEPNPEGIDRILLATPTALLYLYLTWKITFALPGCKQCGY